MFTRALLSVTGIAEHPELFRFFEKYIANPHLLEAKIPGLVSSN
jgi:hypothetical protein